MISSVHLEVDVTIAFLNRTLISHICFLQDKKSVAEDELADISSAFLDMDDDGWVKEATSPQKSAEKIKKSPVAVSSSKPREHLLSPACTPEKRSSSGSPKKITTKREDHDTSPDPTDDQTVSQKSSRSSQVKRPALDLRVTKVFPKSENKLRVPENSSIKNSTASKTSETRNGCIGKKITESHSAVSAKAGSASATRAKASTPTKFLPPERPKRDPKFDLWVEKYKPNSLKQIIGQQGEKSNVNKLVNWLKAWHSNHSGNKKIPKPSK